MAKTVNIVTTEKKIIDIGTEVVDIDIPDIFGLTRLQWICDKVKELGYISDGDNVKVVV